MRYLLQFHSFQVAGTNWPKLQYSILVTGISRFRVARVLQNDPYVLAQVETLSHFQDEQYEEFKDSKLDIEFGELVETFRKKAINLLELLDLSIPSVAKLRVIFAVLPTICILLLISIDHFQKLLESIPNHQLADLISSIVNASFNEKLEILNAIDLKDRFSKALPLLLRQIEGLKMLQEKQEQESRDVKKVKTVF